MSCTCNININLACTVGGLALSEPVVAASGIWPYESEMWHEDLVGHLGGICSKAITMEPRKGNDGIRVWETPSGILNSIGLQNPGIEYFLTHQFDALKKHNKPVLLNISMESAEGLDFMMRLVAERHEKNHDIDCIELNVSCPNVDCGCMSWGVSPDLTAQAVEMSRRHWPGPLWVKLTPQAPDIPAVSRAAQDAGASALVVGNTWLGMAIDTNGGAFGTCCFSVGVANRLGRSWSREHSGRGLRRCCGAG